MCHARRRWRARRDNYRHETETSSAMQAAVQPEQEPVRTLPRAMREVCVGQGGENDPTTDPWMQERVGTKRYLHKKEWAAWLEVCRPAFLGYGASSQAERCRRQLVIMDLVRTHLAMGRGEAQRRRDAVAGQAARAAGARKRNSAGRGSAGRGSAGRGCAGTPHRRAGGDALHAERGGACGTDVDARR
ncbi:hypothetical protein ERJ75_001288500 [Trypanosoma vivax]|nr:hypothetical protein ERJ75_001288500 [Trypanosoma vivax]